MAQFEPALAKTLAHEGGFSNDSNDPGGKTFRGISRKAWPSWAGWAIIDRMKEGQDYPESLSKLVTDFYRVNFWLPLHGDEIASQEIAEYLFDFAVNSGIEDAVKALQRAINRECPLPPLSVDGKLGEKTLNELDFFQDSPYQSILFSLRTYRLAHYLETIADNPKLARFARGWARRALT